MARALNTALANMREVLAAGAASADAVAASSEELSASSAQISASAEETSAQSGVVASSAEEVSRRASPVGFETVDSVLEAERDALFEGAALRMEGGT